MRYRFVTYWFRFVCRPWFDTDIPSKHFSYLQDMSFKTSLRRLEDQIISVGMFDTCFSNLRLLSIVTPRSSTLFLSQTIFSRLYLIFSKYIHFYLLISSDHICRCNVWYKSFQTKQKLMQNCVLTFVILISSLNNKRMEFHAICKVTNINFL